MRSHQLSSHALAYRSRAISSLTLAIAALLPCTTGYAQTAVMEDEEIVAPSMTLDGSLADWPEGVQAVSPPLRAPHRVQRAPQQHRLAEARVPARARAQRGAGIARRGIAVVAVRARLHGRVVGGERGLPGVGVFLHLEVDVHSEKLRAQVSVHVLEL